MKTLADAQRAILEAAADRADHTEGMLAFALLNGMLRIGHLRDPRSLATFRSGQL
jgi:hypothetical protein